MSLLKNQGGVGAEHIDFVRCVTWKCVLGNKKTSRLNNGMCICVYLFSLIVFIHWIACVWYFVVAWHVITCVFITLVHYLFCRWFVAICQIQWELLYIRVTSTGWIVIWLRCSKPRNWLETLLSPLLYVQTCLDYVILPFLMWLTSLLMSITHVWGWEMVDVTNCASPSHWRQLTLKGHHIAVLVQLVIWQVRQVVAMDGSAVLWQSSSCLQLALRLEPSVLIHTLLVCLSNQWWVDRCLCNCLVYVCVLKFMFLEGVHLWQTFCIPFVRSEDVITEM